MVSNLRLSYAEIRDLNPTWPEVMVDDYFSRGDDAGNLADDVAQNEAAIIALGEDLTGLEHRTFGGVRPSAFSELTAYVEGDYVVNPAVDPNNYFRAWRDNGPGPFDLSDWEMVSLMDAYDTPERFESIVAASLASIKGDSLLTDSFYGGWAGGNPPQGGALYYRTGTTGAPSTLFTDNSGFYDADGIGFRLSYKAIRTPLEYGARRDGSTDDTQAIQFCLNANDHVFLPAGDYRYTALVIDRDDIRLQGAGRTATKLICTDPTANSITIGAPGGFTSNIYIDNIWFATASGDLRTGGAVIKGYALLQCTFRDLYVTDIYDGIAFEGVGRTEVIDVWFRRETRTLISNRAIIAEYDPSTSTSASNLKLIRVDGAGTLSYINEFFYIATADWVLLDQCHINGANYGLVIDHQEVMVDVWVTNTYMDRADVNQVRVIGNSGEAFRNLKFTNVYFHNNQTSRNVSFENTGSEIDAVHFVQCQFFNAPLDGFYMASENIQLVDFIGCRFQILAASGGVAIDSKAISTLVDGCSFDTTNGANDVLVTRAASSGSLIITSSNFIRSNAPTKYAYTNLVFVEINNNVAAADQFLPLKDEDGFTNVALDATGQALIPHNLGVTPAFYHVQRVGDTGEEATIVAISATDITVRVRDTDTNADVASVNRNIKWYVKA